MDIKIVVLARVDQKDANVLEGFVTIWSISKYDFDFVINDDYMDMLYVLGYNKCVLVGHDWGGILATIFTANYPEMVEKLVLIQAPHKLGFARVIRSSIRQLLMSW